MMAQAVQPEPSASGPSASGPFRVGDRVQLTGPRGIRHTVSLEPDGEFHTHRGVLAHNDLIGASDASVVRSSSGVEYLAIRPLLADFVMSMPRGAAIVYPKDAAQILAFADIFPGAVVVEAGVGSGALSLWLLRAIGETGSLHSIERREEFADVARANAATFFGALPKNWRLSLGDLQDVLPAAAGPGSVDRVVLDMLAPWECVDAVAEALVAGGVVVCYVATVTQLSRTAEALRASGAFTAPESTETMVRGWHVEGLAVRPDHRMIAHTGFLITARRLAAGTVLPEVRRRASKSDYEAEDLDAWTPGALGERPVSAKALRKRVREATRSADLARVGAAEDELDDEGADEDAADGHAAVRDAADGDAAGGTLDRPRNPVG